MPDERLIRTLIEEERTRQFFKHEVRIADAALEAAHSRLMNADDVVEILVAQLRERGYTVVHQWDHWVVTRDETPSA